MASEKIKEKEAELIRLVTDFCNDELDENYKNLAVALVEKMGRKHDVPFKRGKLDIWASAVIYALGQINFLFDKNFEPYKTPDDICNYFNTKKSTVSQKAKVIRDMFNMKHFDNEFSTDFMVEEDPHITLDDNGFEYAKNLNGLNNELKLAALAENLKILAAKSSFTEGLIFDDEDEEDFDISELLDDGPFDGGVDFDDEDFDLSEFLEDSGARDYWDYSSECTTLEEYEEAIENFKERCGEEYFEENKGYFWGLVETRPFMQNLFDYANLLWDSGLKQKAVDTCEYMLELNPGDNQGVRDSLVNYYIDLNRLDDAEDLIDFYDEYAGANWDYSRLLIAIKNKEDKKIIKELYDEAFEENPHVIDYIFNKKQVDELPAFYSWGDENEAKLYKYLSLNNWDKKSLKTLRKVMK